MAGVCLIDEMWANGHSVQWSSVISQLFIFIGGYLRSSDKWLCNKDKDSEEKSLGGGADALKLLL